MIARLLIITSLIAASQFPMRRPRSAVVAGAAVMPGTSAYDFNANIGVTCSGACSNGSVSTGWSDQSGNTHTGTAVGSPTYQTSVLNSLPVVRFNAAVPDTFTIASPLTLTGSFSILGVVRPSSLAANREMLSGGTTWTGSATYRADTTGKQEFVLPAVASVGTGTSTSAYNTTTFTATMMTYDGTNWAFYTCSGGTATADGSGTNAQTVTAASDKIGGNPSESFSGDIARLIVWQRILSSTERTNACGAVQTAYGL